MDVFMIRMVHPLTSLSVMLPAAQIRQVFGLDRSLGRPVTIPSYFPTRGSIFCNTLQIVFFPFTLVRSMHAQ